MMVANDTVQEGMWVDMVIQKQSSGIYTSEQHYVTSSLSALMPTTKSFLPLLRGYARIKHELTVNKEVKSCCLLMVFSRLLQAK